MAALFPMKSTDVPAYRSPSNLKKNTCGTQCLMHVMHNANLMSLSLNSGTLINSYLQQLVWFYILWYSRLSLSAWLNHKNRSLQCRQQSNCKAYGLCTVVLGVRLCTFKKNKKSRVRFHFLTLAWVYMAGRVALVPSICCYIIGNMWPQTHKCLRRREGGLLC